MLCNSRKMFVAVRGYRFTRNGRSLWWNNDPRFWGDARQLTDGAGPDLDLGVRGLRIEPLSDERASDFDLSGPTYLPAEPPSGGRVREIVERLIGYITQ